ncbi:MAG: CRISPR-associated endonuclease Cas1 [Planctomycetota bacterium]|nr:CRISPR-associated endonuclease Cas1 [Planctomycetota bacterium]
MVNEYVYCPRLFYLEWVQREWDDNHFTEDGRFVHRRANRESKAPPTPDEHQEEEAPPFKARSVSACSERLGLTTKMDVVEGDAGEVVPVEYKRGSPPDVPHRVWDPERVQVCAQALVLRDCGYQVPHGVVYFAQTKERVHVELDDALVAMTEQAIRDLRVAAAQPLPPPPLVDSPKCDGCSLVGICLPDEVNLLRATEAAPEQEAELAPVRRLHPARDDALPVYVQRPGARIGLAGAVLQVRQERQTVAESRLEHTSQVSIFGNVQVSTQALRELLYREIPVVLFSGGGWFYGLARGLGNTNVELRREQCRVADDPPRSLALARRFVATKIANQRTILRRHLPARTPALERMSKLRERATEASDPGTLLGLEGTAARLYFDAFPGLLKVSLGDFSPDGRNRRPPRDPLNALLSFVYSLLTKEWTVTCAAVGFDPFLGFFHRPRFGRPALALDLMEEFRPIVGDSIVLAIVNNGTVGERDFVRRGVGVALTDAARRRVISAYERRLDELVTHPVFGYRISYRRVFEVQARLLARHLAGEIPTYPEFRTR